MNHCRIFYLTCLCVCTINLLFLSVIVAVREPCIKAGLVTALLPHLNSNDQEMLLNTGRAIGRICFDSCECVWWRCLALFVTDTHQHKICFSAQCSANQVHYKSSKFQMRADKGKKVNLTKSIFIGAVSHHVTNTESCRLDTPNPKLEKQGVEGLSFACICQFIWAHSLFLYLLPFCCAPPQHINRTSW